MKIHVLDIELERGLNMKFQCLFHVHARSALESIPINK